MLYTPVFNQVDTIPQPALLAPSEQAPIAEERDGRHWRTGCAATDEDARRLKMPHPQEETPLMGALKAIRAAPTLVEVGIEKALAQDTNCNARSTSSILFVPAPIRLAVL